ncbi:MAG: ATP-binding protein [Ignavibacteriales bacterium]|nr:ATP-binding protein [Ignavibacteriales bacterium]
MKRVTEKTFSQSFSIVGREFFDAGKVSTEIKTMLKELGVDAGIIRRIAIAMYEAEMNVVMYATEATVTLELSPKAIRIVVDDRGPGIPDVELAMQEGYSTATTEMREMGFGAGMGLPNIKKNADHFRIDSVVGKGTRLEISISMN